jgi:hypothetical protein
LEEGGLEWGKEDLRRRLDCEDGEKKIGLGRDDLGGVWSEGIGGME